MKPSHRGYDALKRALDLLVAIVLVVVLSPVLLGIALAVLIGLGRPVLFCQQRPGKDGRLFTMRKFRTMRTAPHGTDAVSAVATDAERLTRLGRFLRATSLDELPELLNVIAGDMSIVGPRPLLPEYLPRYTAEQARRHEVRPGITGWAQVNGRNAVSWDERFKMDVYYVDNRSLSLDARIVWMTLATVLKREGVSAADSATMRPYEPDASAPDKEDQ